MALRPKYPNCFVVSSEPVTSIGGQDEIIQSLAAGRGICAWRAAQGGSWGPGRCRSKEQQSLMHVSVEAGEVKISFLLCASTE